MDTSNDIVTTQPGQCENCLPDATIWATSTPSAGPKSYFMKIKDGETEVFFELKHYAKDKKIIAEPYRPADYDYTMHDSCDHEHDECIMETDEFLEQEYIDRKARDAGYGREVQP